MSTTLKVLDLFSGIGGFSLGLERTKAFKTVAFCEIEKYCQLVLQNHWKGVKIYNDVKRITKEQLQADGITNIDVITGGFPCQPFSVAGKQKGTHDDRHLWPEMFRIIKDVKPKWVIGENVKNLINIQDGVVFETVCTDLENAGYEVQTFNIPAASVGAPHQRERIWIVAHAISDDEKQTISRGNGETDQIPTEYRENNDPTGISSGASGVRSARHEYVEDSNNHGLERRFSETRNEISSGKEPKINGIQNSNFSSGRSDGRGDQEESKSNGTIQGLRNGHQKESSRTTGVRKLSERSDNSERTLREDRNQKNDNRTLVQKGQSGVQSPIGGRLEEDQTSFENREVRQGVDDFTFNRMETGRKGNENVEDSRRTLRSWTELGGKNEDEDRKENANQFERSGETRETVMANPSSQQSHSENNGRQPGEAREPKQVELGGGSGGSLWPSNWEFEPNVGRVADGIPGRAHRLKGLGNAIVPQIAEEIGKAIRESYNQK